MIIKDVAKKLIYFQIIYNCIIKFFIVDFRFPSLLNYVTDAITLLLLFLVLKHDNYRIQIGKNKSTKSAMLLFVLGSVSAFVSYDGNPFLYIWSLRNNFRLFAFFYCCIKVLNEEDVYKLLEALLMILYLNIFVCLYEYFIKGIRYDYLGGLFGNGIKGGNGPLNALMIVTVPYLITEYINKKKTVWHLLLGIGGCLFIAVVGELKIFFFEIILLIILVCVFVTSNFRMALFIVAITLIGTVGMNYYIKLYPHRANFLNLAYVLQYSRTETYGTSSEMNRLTALKVLSEYCFENNIKKVLFGLGMGNGEVSSQYAFLTSSFYNQYGLRLRYDWFSHAFLFVEFGFVGLILYLLFFAFSGIKSFLERKNNRLNQVSLIVSVFLMLMVFYNQVLRIESFCYTAALFAAIPYIVDKKKKLLKG